ncbi:STY4528 family pathogenicity island replication protein [[Pseudomonas] boreopolis]|uniref:STY4528 family pathogenicity island replication protein n=1 Tax=Xanthomonas boreopolis TaxID=86183 RepID=UPI003D51A546
MSHPHPTSRETSATPTVLPAVPLALLLDKRLMPLERNAWMILRASANAGGHVTDLSYMQLRQFLACVPENELASRETVARTLTVLRLTRWIHVEAHTRNPLTGHLSTNHYVVHSQPVSITRVCHSDLTWIALLEQSFQHASLAVRQVARHVLVELAADPDALTQMPASIRERVQQLPLPPSSDDDDPPSSTGQHDLPVGDHGRSDNRPASEQPNGTVRNSFCSKSG